MRSLLLLLLSLHQGGAFLVGLVPSRSRMTAPTFGTELTATSARRPRATVGAVASLRSREDGDGDEDVEGFISSLKSSGLLGGNSGAGLGDGGAKGLADLEEPGKLVREAAKPFREEMDRIEADFQRSISEKEEEMERKMEEMMKKIDESK